MGALYVNECKNVIVVNQQRINGITVENCHGCHFILTSVISSFQMLRCNQCVIQISDRVPTITLDYCNGCTIKLNQTLLDNKPDICTNNVDTLTFEFDQAIIDGLGTKMDRIQRVDYSQYINKNANEKKKYCRANIDPKTLKIQKNNLKI